MKIFKFFGSYVIISFLLSGCIGTDIVDDITLNQLSIKSRIVSLAVGETFQFEADFFNEAGEMSDIHIVWESSDTNIISIDNTGLATAIGFGQVIISATAGDITDTVELVVSNTTELASPERMGEFRGVNNYNVEGDFVLKEGGNGLILTFQESFRASSGPGLFVYLSNSPTSVTGGFEIGSLQGNSGSQTYTISNPDLNLETYDYVLVYCKPFGVAFGTGELSN